MNSKSRKTGGQIDPSIECFWIRNAAEALKFGNAFWEEEPDQLSVTERTQKQWKSISPEQMSPAADENSPTGSNQKTEKS